MRSYTSIVDASNLVNVSPTPSSFDNSSLIEWVQLIYKFLVLYQMFFQLTLYWFSFFRKIKPSNDATKSVHDKSLVAEKNQIDEELCFSVIITLLFCIGLAVNIACLFRLRPYNFLLTFWHTDITAQWKFSFRKHSNIT